ncbi:MAG: DUF86 domain-containing protein [Euryarchaeota archaeon]|nr:DUF86 domain-containing protein [Euryarchaeota archaeon]
MDGKRAGQYRSKIGYIIDKMHTIPEDVGTMDDLSIDGVLYRVQTSIDAAVDMVAMLVHDMGISVGDDYENIDHLLAKNVINRELAQNIKKLNGMRNAVVHRYGAVDVELIFENIEEIKRILYEFIEIIEVEPDADCP